MKSISNLSIANRQVVIIVDDLTLNSIKHIVSIAPQEAQWFHTITPITSEPGLVQLKLSQRLYIPKQNTSTAQVDSTSSMMVDFYNELKSGSLTQDEINATLNSMGCWCHSHHNMAPNPSAQDLKQFNFFVQSALEQNQNNWQIALIFNKRNEFYSRVYDPETGIIFEGVPIVKTNNYDFSYIDRAAKEKFLSRKPKGLASPFLSLQSSRRDNTHTTRSLPVRELDIGAYGFDLSINIIDSALAQINPRRLPGTNDTYSFTSDQAVALLDAIEDHIDYQEFVWFLMILTGNKKSIHKCFTTAAFDKHPFDYEAMLDDLIGELEVGFSSTSLSTALDHVFEISQLPRLKDVKPYIQTLTSF